MKVFLSPQEELFQDIISILHIFSCRIYGLRKYKKKIRGMKKLKRAYKIEINPTDDQKSKIHQTIGVSRFIYNFYIAHNKEIYEKEGKFVSGMDFFKVVK